MAEDEVVVRLVGRALEVALELAGEAIGERDRTNSSRALGTPERAPRVALGDPDAAGDPVDVAPAQSEQLADPQAGHRGSQVERALDLAQDVVGHGADQRLDLGRAQELDPLLAVSRLARLATEEGRYVGRNGDRPRGHRGR